MGAAGGRGLRRRSRRLCGGQEGGNGAVCALGAQNSAGLLKHEVQGSWEVGGAGEAGGGLGKSNSQSF